MEPKPEPAVEVNASEERQLKHISLSTLVLTKKYFNEDDVDEHLGAFLEEDKTSVKTLSRTFVENFMQNYKWYFPGKDRKGDGAPSLEKAWAYYEHYTLARQLIGEDGKPLPGKPRAEPGEEKPSELYNPFTTAESNLSEWGIGVALYFATLRVMAVILILAGLINIPNIRYYASYGYSGGQQDLSFSLTGSAVCNQGLWVVCTDCVKEDWGTPEEAQHFGSVDNPDGMNTTIVLQNDCEGGALEQGLVNWFSLVFLVICIGLISVYQRKREELFDIGKQTATDYSIVVKNPPPDAYDPEEWRDFFSQFAEKQVTCVTVALNNDQLLRKLLTRRVFRRNLKAQLGKNVNMDNEDEVRVAIAQMNRDAALEQKGCLAIAFDCCICRVLHLFNMFLPAETLVDKIVKLSEEIKELQKAKYDVSEVFVTFETEEGQRNCLSALSVGRMNIWMNKTDMISPSTIFHENVLDVTEPKEPNTIRWLDLHVPSWKKIVQSMINLVLTSGVIVGCGFLVSMTRNSLGPRFSAPLTTMFNSVIPLIVKLLMLIENHSDEGSLQQSLYLKITIFRWVNTAILTQIITPFSATIGPNPKDVLPTINALLWSELFLSPFLRLLDIMGNLKKHILGPRAKTQESMNLSFQGTGYNLGERYTDLTKVLFLCFFYSALFPGTFFFCGAILFVQYYVDKYCLMRIWSPAPFIGTELATFSRRYFFSGALLAFSIVSSYAWAQFPYDNLCTPRKEDEVSVNTFFSNVTFLNGTVADVTVAKDTNVVFCRQNWYSQDGFSFPALPNVLQGQGLRWMSESQEKLCQLFGWTSVVVLVFFVLILFGASLTRFIVGLFRGTYKPSGEDQHIDFSSEQIPGYVPQFKIGAFQYPCIAADICSFDTQMIDWTDPTDPSYNKHNLIYDIPCERMPRMAGGTEAEEVKEDEVVDSTKYRKTKRPIYAVVKSWSPFDKDKTE